MFFMKTESRAKSSDILKNIWFRYKRILTRLT